MLNFTEESLNLICRKIGTQTNAETMEPSAQSAVTMITKKGISAANKPLSLSNPLRKISAFSGEAAFILVWYSTKKSLANLLTNVF